MAGGPTMIGILFLDQNNISTIELKKSLNLGKSMSSKENAFFFILIMHNPVP